MKFWFDVENAFNTPNNSRSFVIDINNERVQRNMDYNHYAEIMRGHATSRVSDYAMVEGEVISELTFNNTAWSWLAGCLLGKRTSITGYKFKEDTSSTWGYVVGYLASDLASDSTSLEITSDSTSLFDGIDSLIINDEVISVGSITGNVASACTRAQQGTIARAHSATDLVYGIDPDVSREIVLCHRNMNSGFREFGDSLTTVLDRDGILYTYSGMLLNEMNFNFRVFDSVNTHMIFVGADSTNDVTLTATSITDSNPIVDLQDIKVYSFGSEEYLRQFYIQIHNTTDPSGFGFDGIVQKFFLAGCSTFGVITWTEESLEHVQQYEANTRKHYSISMELGNYRMIFAMNNVRINTPSHYHDGELIIQDSAPWYEYEDPVIMFQY